MNQILGFITEWGAVLRDSLPSSLQRILGLGRRFVVLESGDGGWMLSQTHGAAFDTQGPIDPARLVGLMGRMEGPVVLVPPEEMAMRPVLTLPGTARRSLEQVLEVEIERLTPFKARDVAVAREVSPTTDGQIRVGLTIIPHIRIEALVAPLRAAGVTVDHIMVDRDRVDRAPELSLITGPDGASRRPAGWAPVLVTLALLLGAVASPFMVQELQLRDQRAALEALRPDVAAVKRLAQDVELLEARERTLRDFAKKRVSMSQLLEAVTHALPDHTWLVQYQYDDTRLTLEGQSLSATSLVDVLSTSTWLDDVRFHAPVTRDPATGADRFRLNARVGNP